MSVVVTAGERSLPLCSYPSYPRYVGGSANMGGRLISRFAIAPAITRSFDRGDVNMARRATRLVSLSTICGVVVCAATLIAQTPATAPFPKAPEGFDVRKPGVQAGRVERIEYDSKVTGNKRPAVVYLPPAIRPRANIPCCLCCLHRWQRDSWTQPGRGPTPSSTTLLPTTRHCR